MTDEAEQEDDIDSMKKGPLRAKQIMGRRMRLRRGITMDSGAAANVMPRRMCRYPRLIRPSPGSIAGVKYVAANDGIIRNEGAYDFNFTTSEDHSEAVVMQIAEANKALGSVAYFVDRAYQVVYDKDMSTGKDLSRMTHKPSGRISNFRREKSIWILDALAHASPVFSRPGNR